jgi:hypothetical protein
MSKSRRKQESDITRIVGILFLELVGAIILLNLAQFAQQQRTQIEPPSSPISTFSNDFQLEKSLPKVAHRRYNARL